jgi:hypothetical protein
MNAPRFVFGLGALVALASSIAFSGIARSADSRGIAGRSYLQTNLVSDIPGLAAHTDPNLKNPWGTSVGPGSPIWVSDNHAGVTTLYDGAGNPQPLSVAIPAPPSAGDGAVGAPTGQAFNTFDPASSDFVISENGKSGPAFFLFATEDGTIAGWNPNVDRARAVIAVDRSTATDSAGDVGANYKGLALVTRRAASSSTRPAFASGRSTSSTATSTWSTASRSDRSGRVCTLRDPQHRRASSTSPSPSKARARTTTSRIPATGSSTFSLRTVTCSSGSSAEASSTHPGL